MITNLILTIMDKVKNKPLFEKPLKPIDIKSKLEILQIVKLMNGEYGFVVEGGVLTPKNFIPLEEYGVDLRHMYCCGFDFNQIFKKTQKPLACVSKLNLIYGDNWVKFNKVGIFNKDLCTVRYSYETNSKEYRLSLSGDTTYFQVAYCELNIGRLESFWIR